MYSIRASPFPFVASLRRLPHSDYIEGSSYPCVRQTVSTGDDEIVVVTIRLQCCTDLRPQRPPGVLMDRGHIRTIRRPRSTFQDRFC